MGSKRRFISKRGGRGFNRGRALFVGGGYLDDWDAPSSPSSSPFATPPITGRKASGRSAERSSLNSRGSGKRFSGSGSGSGSSMCGRNDVSFTYTYPEEQLISPMVLGDLESNPIVAFVDKTPSSDPICKVPSYSYDSSVNSGHHFGLGFHEYEEEEHNEDMEVRVESLIPSSDMEKFVPIETGVVASSSSQKQRFRDYEEEEHNEEVEVKEKSLISSSKIEKYGPVETEIVASSSSQQQGKRSNKKQNDGFISIGGMKLYTVDLSSAEEENEGFMDEEDENDDDGSPYSSESSCTDSEEEDHFIQETTTDYGEDELDMDEEVMEDYLEGIGGIEKLFKGRYLDQNLDLSSDDDEEEDNDSSDSIVEKVGGIALMNASKNYGMKNQKKVILKGSQKGRNTATPVDKFGSLILDDLLFENDTRSFMGKKKIQSHLSQSWPNEAQKHKKYKEMRGGKKKHRKEVIALKRRERMLSRGVDLDQINLKLRKMVLGEEDMVSFHPMHSRDCSQVQRLASIYRLRSGCQGSGKKRFVTITRTVHTCLPSLTDQARLEKLLRTGDKDEDFVVNRVERKSLSARAKGKMKIRDAHVFAPNKSTKRTTIRKSNESSGRKREEGVTKADYASRPVSFIRCGIMQVDTEESMTVDSCEQGTDEKVVLDKFTTVSLSNNSAEGSLQKVGAFEMHTKGFGSKMMAKMGFIEGAGLGKDGQGISQPVEAIKRPKSLGLGMQFIETSESEEQVVRLKSDGQNTNFPTESNRKSKPVRGVFQSSTASRFNRRRTEEEQIGAFEKHTKGFGSRLMSQMGFVPGSGLGKNAQGIVNPLSAARLPKSRGLGAK